MSIAEKVAPRRQRKGSGVKAAEARWSKVFLAPWIIGFVVFTAFPMIASLLLSFTKYPILKSPTWNGIDNFVRMFTEDRNFWHSLKVTAIYTVVVVPLELVLGYSLAVLLNQAVKGLSIFRTMFYLPAVTPAVATSLIWLWVFQPDSGILNRLLGLVGIEGIGWIHDPKYALFSLILANLWGVGGGMVIYLAGLQSVPTALYESAELDGAGAWTKFVSITIPLTSPVIFFNLVRGMIGAFQVFASAFVMTGGGPANATLFYVLYLYRNGWLFLKMGYASALAWVLVIIIMVFTLLTLRLGGRMVYYEGGGSS